MPELWEFGYRIKKFYRFNNEEIKGLIITIALLGFIWSYNIKLTFGDWFSDFIKSIIMFGIAMFFHVSAQKIYGIYHGYQVEYKYWLVGLIIGVVVTLITNGYLPLLLPGGMVLLHLSRLRIGYFRYGLNVWQSSQTAIAGPYTNVILVMFLKALIWQFFGYDSELLNEFFKLNILLAVYTMLPIPPLPGVIAFYGSKLLYVFSFALMLMYILLIIIFDYYSIILGAILGFIIYIIYYLTVEKGD